MTKRTIEFGGQFAFAADGGTETISSVSHTVSATYAPANDSSLYLPVGNVPKFDISNNAKKQTIRGPVSYAYARLKSYVTGYDPVIKHTLTDWNEMSLQSIFGLVAAPTAAMAGAQPFKLGTLITGWLLLKAGDQTDTQIIEQILRVEFEVAQLAGEEGKHAYEAMYHVLQNSLNTFKLPAFAAN